MRGSNNNQPLRVLYISPLFVPLASTEALCGARMALALMEQGVDIQILYDRRYLDLPNARRDTSGVWEPLWSVMAETGAASQSLRGALYSSVRYLAYSRWAHVAIKRAQELHEEKPFDFVYSRSLPMQAHVVGYWCSRKLGIPWVANINDPWDTRHSPVKAVRDLGLVHRRVSRYWLRKTLRAADLLTFTCERLGRFTMEAAGVSRPYVAIPHVGWRRPPQGHVDERFNLIHAGSISLEYGRSSQGILNGYKLFLERRPEARQDMVLTFLGLDSPDAKAFIKRLGLGTSVRGTPRVSYEESLEWIAGANAGVLVEAEIQEGVTLLAKLVDYIAARKPVLALSPPEGTVADMCPDPGLVHVNQKDLADVAAGIMQLYEKFKAGTLEENQPSEELVRRFDAAAVAKQFLDAVERAGIVKKGREPVRITRSQ